MPVYNGQRHLAAAIDSIRQQTLADWELIVVDDGSTDASPKIVEGYHDRRIKLMRLDRNRGVAAALNAGLECATGRMVARMDADDLSHPRRLAVQSAFLEAHGDVTVCGSWVRLFGASRGVWRFPTDDAGAKSMLLFAPPFAHPAVMMRRRLIDDGWRYDPGCGFVEDYDLWVRVRAHYRFANLDIPLLDYRIHAAQVGSRLRAEQEAAAKPLRRCVLRDLGIDPDTEQELVHSEVSNGQRSLDAAFLLRAEAWLRELSLANRHSPVFPEKAFNATLFDYWWRVCHRAVAAGGKTWLIYRASALRSFATVSRLDEWKFHARCLLKQHPEGA